MQTRWHFSASSQAWLDQALVFVARAEREALAARGAFHIVLAGGGTPRAVYEALARENHDWPRWQVWFGDERCLPADHPERNSAMARALLARLGASRPPLAKGGGGDLPTSTAGTETNPPPFGKVGGIHVIPGELGATEAAAAYAAELADIGDFDLVILGLGEDGHTASLFPGHMLASQADTVAVFDAPKPPAERVSLSAPRLSRARLVLFLVSGVGKRDALVRWKQDDPTIPATSIQPEAGVDVLLAPDLSTSGVLP